MYKTPSLKGIKQMFDDCARVQVTHHVFYFAASFRDAACKVTRSLLPLETTDRDGSAEDGGFDGDFQLDRA